MNTMELARALAAHGETEDAKRAYLLSLQQADGADPDAELEAACYLFDHGEDYRVPYTTFQSLYNRGHFQESLFDLMVGAFYAPNLKPQEKTYRRNCKLLEKYPYLFRRDFLPFEDLPVKLFPYDDKGFLPFDTRENHFGDYRDPGLPVVSRNFFKDLEKPILATDVYSQYELEYLNDNVRRSDWAARENHIYLHYTDWGTFCSYLQWLDLRELMKEEKPVFLMEDELSLYPIDFKERFGIDYSTYTVKPFGIREVNRLIWHTQLSSHNGGDFFNEVFHGHPNLLAYESVMYDSLLESVQQLKGLLQTVAQKSGDLSAGEEYYPDTLRQLTRIKAPTEKDILVTLFLGHRVFTKDLDRNARIAPALFFQPHFSNINYTLFGNSEGRAGLDSEQYRSIQKSALFLGFKYIKTFTPMRRLTTSYGAALRFMVERKTKSAAIRNEVYERVLNRSYMVDWQDRLFTDSVLVRFEDGKLNPKATFTALAAFLDLPYTESMTYCSGVSGINPESLAGNDRGFDPAAVYRTYDEYANDAERCFLEYFLRDVYEYYGYDFHYYHGEPMDMARVRELVRQFTTLHHYERESYLDVMKLSLSEGDGPAPDSFEMLEKIADSRVAVYDADTLAAAEKLLQGLYFVNQNGQPLRMMTPLKLDPALLEQPLYH